MQRQRGTQMQHNQHKQHNLEAHAHCVGFSSLVGLAVGLDPEGYGNPDFCWLSVHDTLIWSIAGPIAIVVLVSVYVDAVYLLDYTGLDLASGLCYSSLSHVSPIGQHCFILNGRQGLMRKETVDI